MDIADCIDAVRNATRRDPVVRSLLSRIRVALGGDVSVTCVSGTADGDNRVKTARACAPSRLGLPRASD